MPAFNQIWTYKLPKYKKNSVTGDAGEYYFSYWITRYFSFACRLQPIDLGIDAIIELVDTEEAKGDLISVQIKTTDMDNCSAEEIKRVGQLKKDFDVAHLQYWSDSQLPMIFVFIIYSSTKEPDMYVKNIQDEYIIDLINNLKPNQKTKRIQFQPCDKLDIKYKAKLLDIYTPSAEVLSDLDKLKELAHDFISGTIYCNHDAIGQVNTIFTYCSNLEQYLNSKVTLRNSNIYSVIEDINEKIKDKLCKYLSLSSTVKEHFIEDCNRQYKLHPELSVLIQDNK